MSSAGPDAGALFVGSTPAAAESDVSSELAIDIPAAGTIDVPGPAAGFARVFQQIYLFTQAGASMGAIPIFLIDAAATSWQMQGGTPSSQSVLYQVTTPLFENEVIRLGANPGPDARVVAAYRDIPAANLAPIRATLSTVPTDAIPAPAAGRARRLYKRPYAAAFAPVGAQIINRDTVTCSVRWSLGATLYSRSNVTNGTQAAPVGPIPDVWATAASGALSVALGLAHTTTAPIILGAYEEHPL